jgi:hypothetical protein
MTALGTAWLPTPETEPAPTSARISPGSTKKLKQSMPGLAKLRGTPE